ARDTSGSLHDKLAALGAGQMVATLLALENGEVAEEPQDEAKVTYAEKLQKEEAKLDWRLPASRLDRQIRGLNPWPVAETSWPSMGNPVRIWRAWPVAEGSGGAAGEVLGLAESPEGEGIRVAAGVGDLVILEIQPPGRKKMDGGAFARGYPCKPGLMLGEGAPRAQREKRALRRPRPPGGARRSPFFRENARRGGPAGRAVLLKGFRRARPRVLARVGIWRPAVAGSPGFRFRPFPEQTERGPSRARSVAFGDVSAAVHGSRARARRGGRRGFLTGSPEPGLGERTGERGIAQGGRGCGISARRPRRLSHHMGIPSEMAGETLDK
ncbi:MAG: hypothetical protein J4F48_13045, partial [Nitrospinae bacterium]|nr:hypothetical protein [Nitrospinota bacterium]